jgi:hypothetical protein
VYMPGDIRRYGATTASADNSAAINNALLVSSNGGNAAYLPAGTWTITTALSAVGASSMRGEGAQSVLAPNGCDGIDFPAFAPSQPARRVFRDFAIIGSSTNAKHGLSCNVQPSAAWAIDFSDISIQNFSAAIYAAGFRSCTFKSIYAFNNYYGVFCIGQNTNLHFWGCEFIRGTITGTGGAWGVSIQLSGGNSTQDTSFIDCYIYGYDIGVNCQLGFETQFDDCDISNCQQTAVNISTIIGGFWLTNSWVETNANAATTGVIVAAQGTNNFGDIHINDNHINCTTAHTGSIGLSLPGQNQNGVIANGNEFQGFETGISNVGGANFTSKWGTFNGVTTWVLLDSAFATDNEIGPNSGGTGTQLAFSGATPTGLRYFSRGSFTATLTGMSTTVTGTIRYSVEGAIVALSWPDITGTSNSTAMTVTGMPAVIAPVNAQVTGMRVYDNATPTGGSCSIATSGTITCFKDWNSGVFTASGSKGLAGASAVYPIL